MAPSRIRARLTGYKRAAYRAFFRHVRSRFDFPLIRGRQLQSLRDNLLARVEYKESVCNAGFVRVDEGYLCVAKNQRFNHCREMGLREARGWPPVGVNDDRKRLYQIEFDATWQLRSCDPLDVWLDGRPISTEEGVEDVRLFRFEGALWAYVTGQGNRRSAWPLLGRLDSSGLRLSTTVGSFSPPQKNWMPFEADGRLWLEYSVEPHVVLSYDPGTARCEPVHRNAPLRASIDFELHGGAPAVRLDERHFLGVANSQHRYWYQDRYYAPVFYLFEAKPPFRVLTMTRPVRIQSHSERIHYVSGMALSDDRNSLLLSIGICDCDCRFFSVSLASVLSRLH